MSSPERTDNVWSVYWGDALSIWLFSCYPDDWEFESVEAWIDRCHRHGPPPDQERVLEGVFQAIIRPTTVIATYLLDEEERVVLLREIR